MNQRVAPTHLQKHPPIDRMPPHRPLNMPVQDFKRPFTDLDAPPIPTEPYIWARRVVILLLALLIAATLGTFFAQWLSADGLSAGEVIWVTLVCITFFWVSFIFCLSMSGAVAMARAPDNAACESTLTPPLNVAILMPIYEEDVADVFANLLAMQDDLVDHPHHHNFSTFVLSDSQNPHIIELEMRAHDQARMLGHSNIPLYHRCRDDNQRYKTGNLHQWVRNWGAGYDAMLVLDADSLMSADAILTLTDTLARNPGIGLVQGALHVFAGRRLFARLQQFSSMAFGGMFAHGLSLCSGSEGNYFGHNAIIRTPAFAACAGLPDMPARGGRTVPILSHDFVEAALLRRAGWGVKILPDLEGSFEGAPETLIDYIRRDRRWCRGNMQHLRIMWATGLHPISRCHMFFNALSYLMSPVWLALILIWTGVGFHKGSAGDAAMSHQNFLILLVIFALLLAPKFTGAALILASGPKRRAFGGTASFLALFTAEVVTSMLFAPIFMIHQTMSIYRSVVGHPVQWGAAGRSGVRHSFNVLLRFHVVETGLGLILTAGMLTGVVSFYLLPISVSLMLAPILSHLSTIEVSRHAIAVSPDAPRSNQLSPAVFARIAHYRKRCI